METLFLQIAYKLMIHVIEQLFLYSVHVLFSLQY